MDSVEPNRYKGLAMLPKYPDYSLTNCTASPINISQPTLEEMEAMRKEIDSYRVRREPYPDILLMTKEHWELFKKFTEESGVCPLRSESPPDILGVPVETYTTEAECVGRAIQLRMENPKLVVCVVTLKPEEGR